jgi:hypothetical protein
MAEKSEVALVFEILTNLHREAAEEMSEEQKAELNESLALQFAAYVIVDMWSRGVDPVKASDRLEKICTEAAIQVAEAFERREGKHD